MNDLKIGETGSMTDAKGNKVKFKITKHVKVEETNHRLPDYPRKIISLQEILFPNGRKTIRICYYIYINNGWNFRVSPPFIQKPVLLELFEKARKEGII